MGKWNHNNWSICNSVYSACGIRSCDDIGRKEKRMTSKNIVLTLIGAVIGAIAGYLYYIEIGCMSGTCAITSKPLNSTLYGGVMGGLLSNIFSGKSPKL